MKLSSSFLKFKFLNRLIICAILNSFLLFADYKSSKLISLKFVIDDGSEYSLFYPPKLVQIQLGMFFVEEQFSHEELPF